MIVVTLVIATMSFYLIALVVWMGLHYRSTIAVPPDLVRDTQNALEQKKYNEAYQRLADDPSFLARVLASGVRKLPAGLSHAQRAMELANENATMEMEHRTTYLATVGTLGPMIGLVGTVYGMIMAFHVIAQEGATPQASQLAAGISTALYATLEGIAISIPAIFFYAMFRNRIARLSLEVGIAAEPLLEQFVPGVRPTMPGPTVNHGSAPAPAGAPSSLRRQCRPGGDRGQCPAPGPASDGSCEIKRDIHAPSQLNRDFEHPHSQSDAALGRGASAHHVFHDAGSFRHETRGCDQSSAATGSPGRVTRIRPDV